MRNPQRTALARVDERRRARRVRTMRVLFVLGLLAWTSLAVWWAAYFYRSYQQLRETTMRAYAAEELVVARELGPNPTQPARGLPAIFEVVPLPLDEDTLSFPYVELPLGPADKTHALVVAELERRRLHHESRTKLIMLAGEGSVLVGLLFLVFIGMYRMLVSQWRLNRQTEAFVSAVTHELKSPIAGLRALLETLRNIEMPASDRATYHAMGLDEVRRLDRLVNNVLLSSRLEGASYTAHPLPVPLGATLERIAERKRLYAHEQGGDIHVTIDTDVATMDPEAFEIVVENLVDNALKYSPVSPDIHIAARRAGDDVVEVRVSDNGSGIARDDLHHVFDKFWRSRRTEQTQTKGTGLGLFIARELARASGGDLRVESDGVGKGATFVLVLPV